MNTRGRFMGIGQVLTMPLFFASNAIHPIDVMPDGLEVIAHVHPLTYLVDVLRALMVEDSHVPFGLMVDFGVLFGALLVLVLVLMLVAARLYPRMAR